MNALQALLFLTLVAICSLLAKHSSTFQTLDYLF
jgi:hypothetical protein